MNNEFYVIPVYDESLARGDKIIVYQCRRMWGTGTPADLEIFMREYDGPWP